ncbi:hypothetical protein [Aulosira sp. FACHB-615]|uniref:hypothetical protein n=1 Tax=Aulosira sp. FACHB-615 TaxID=2692777 RepID=UPI001681FFED|nr:hypothetical protein [Aulosira sp. FACHB-615]MBD2489724.1 hypothetical protein [Aulosira sp. FACHB-615]
MLGFAIASLNLLFCLTYGNKSQSKSDRSESGRINERSLLIIQQQLQKRTR